MGAAVARPPPDPVADGEGRPSVPRFGVLAAGQGDEMRERESPEEDGPIDILGLVGQRMTDRTLSAIGESIPISDR